MTRPLKAFGSSPAPLLSARQGHILRAVVSSYMGGALPVGSETISALIPEPLSSASVRNTLAELSSLGLVEKPHRSAGRLPTSRGLRAFLDQLLDVRSLGPFERSGLAQDLGMAPQIRVTQKASRLLSERTRLLGFVLAPQLDQMVLRHISFVRVSHERVMAVLLSQGGAAHQRVLEQPGHGDQAALDRMAAAVNERVAGRTLRDVRDQLVREAAALRGEADLLLERALRIDPTAPLAEADLVVTTRLAMLDQPEFRDPERLREILRAVEEKQRVVAVLDRILVHGRVSVALGDELGDASLRGCALVAAPCGGPDLPLGAVGVLGPRRMDFPHIIPLVSYMSRLLTEHLQA